MTRFESYQNWKSIFCCFILALFNITLSMKSNESYLRQGRLFCFHVRCSLQLLNMKISFALFISMQLNFFQLKIKKMNKMQMRTIYFPMYYIIWQILQNSRKFFFYLSNYLTIHLYLYNFEFFYRIWKAQKKRCPKSQQLNLILTENRHSFSSPMLTGKTVTLQNMWSDLKRKWKSHVQPLVCQFYTEFSIV